MAKINLNSLDMDDLLDLKERLDKRIKDIAQSEIDDLQEKMARLKPLAGGRKSGGGRGPRGKVPAKYKDPKTGKTWSGRGMTPIWLRELEEQGKSREEYAL